MKSLFLLALASTVLGAIPLVPALVLASHPSSDRPLEIVPLRATDPFAEGYEIGYRLGFEQGRTFRAARLGYSPEILGIGGVYEDKRDQRAAIGYQAGFLAGFQDGYTAEITPIAPEIERFNEGYERGYDAGTHDALRCRSDTNCTYNPVPTSDRGENMPDNSGYKVGYWQAFDRAWNAAPTSQLFHNGLIR